MDTSINSYEEIAKRITVYYPECEISQPGEVLVIELPMGELEVRGLHLSAFAFGEHFDELDFQNEDELYGAIESYILAMKNEEKKCNPTFITAQKNAEKCCRWVLYAGGAAFLLLVLGYYLFDLSKLVLIIALLMPFASVFSMRFVRLKSFQRDWICPHCEAKLPLETKEWIPQLKPVSRCPECRKGMLDKSLMEQLKHEILSEDGEETQKEKTDAIHAEKPKRGGKRACTVWSILLLVFALIFGRLMFVDIEQVAPVITAVNAITLLLTAAAGAALLRCSSAEQESSRAPKIAVCEQKWLPAVGVTIGILGLLFQFISFALSGIENASLGEVVPFAVLGLSFIGLSVWMLLARKNRALLIYDSRLVYITSFGRRRDVELTQIAMVHMTANKSIRFLDQAGKKLFSVETNMAGADQMIDWVVDRNFSISTTKTLEKQVEQSINAKSVVSWREEDRTPLHDYLGAIRIGLALVILLFAAGCTIPFLLYLFADIKMSHTIYLTAISPLPIVLYYIVFTPVFHVGDYPAGATNEWKSMHIKFPLLIVLILDVLAFAQVFYFWESNMLQIVDFGRFFILAAAFAAVLIVLLWIRTPKRLRKGDFYMMFLSLVMSAFVMAYGGNLAISKPLEHYPAVVVDRRGPTAENEDIDRTLTILLNDGTTAELNVSKVLYDMEKEGTKFVVCQRENFLGIRMVRLHLPK